MLVGIWSLVTDEIHIHSLICSPGLGPYYLSLFKSSSLSRLQTALRWKETRQCLGEKPTAIRRFLKDFNTFGRRRASLNWTWTHSGQCQCAAIRHKAIYSRSLTFFFQQYDNGGKVLQKAGKRSHPKGLLIPTNKRVTKSPGLNLGLTLRNLT